MNPWLAVAAATIALVVLLAAVIVVRARRDLRRVEAEMATRIEQLSAELHARIEQTQHEPAGREEPSESFVITSLSDLVETSDDARTVEREAQLVEAVDASRPAWVPSKPVREGLIRALALSHGVRRALSPERRDRIVLEMQAEVRRSRRQRRAEMRTVRRYLREQRRESHSGQGSAA